MHQYKELKLWQNTIIYIQNLGYLLESDFDRLIQNLNELQKIDEFLFSAEIKI